MSVSEERTVQPSPTTAASRSGIADPAPLGLAAFALTTFLLSAKNAGWMTHATGSAWLGYAFAYGGLAQLLRRHVGVPQQERLRRGRVLYLRRLLDRPRPVGRARRNPASRPSACHGGGDGPSLNHDLGWILLAFAIFNTYMLILSTQMNMAVFVVFLTLGVTEIILSIGNFNAGAALLPTGTIKVGGYVGIVTAVVAWYTSAAGVSSGHRRQAQAARGAGAHQVNIPTA